MTDPFARHGSADLLPFRRRTARTHAAQPVYDQLMADIQRCDDDLLGIVERRRALARRLTNLAETCWPLLADIQGYRPPRADELPMPDVAEDAEPVIAARLRAIVMTLLRRYGECDLWTIHCLLVVHGFRIRSTRPVKALADALTIEVRSGRAVRVRRGVYACHASFRPRPGRSGDVALVPCTPWSATASTDQDLPSPIAWT